MTTISTLLSVIMLPINLVLYANTAFHADVVKTIDWPALFVSLVIVISAIVIGLVCSARIEWPGFNAFANKVRITFMCVCVCVCVCVSLARNHIVCVFFCATN